MAEHALNAPQGRITPRMLVDMINPGAVLLSALAPALLGVLLAVEARGAVSPWIAAVAVLIPVLMNASIDLLNDYYDFVRGNDTAENISSETDAPLAYHHVADPAPVKRLGIALLVLALALGAWVVAVAGWIPGVIGVSGALIVLAYSGGSHPLSHLPVGEVVAGSTMGGLIPLGVYSALTGRADALVVWKAVPMMLIVAQFMLVNNTCDIERDRQAGRRTLPILIGRAAARKVCTGLTLFWCAQMALVTALWYPKGLAVLAVMFLLCGRGFLAMCRTHRTPEGKEAAVGPVALASLGVAAGYPLALLVHLLLS